ncbi:hypothetical protein RJ639_037869 [Escallonia herrerae]|uniref:RBR-type E3 ubiquitin transferase n=1 Tax=Escallonia herrerae TaxID=1293975 RepID=A0AA88WK77_9ASTE|nr:hypothetical protein RJ639_037869 [Escallonia herrerae]
MDQNCELRADDQQCTKGPSSGSNESTPFHKREDDDMLHVADDIHAEELQLQEAIIASLISSPYSKSAASPQVIQEKMDIAKEDGELSQSFCEICMESSGSWDLFTVERCCHSICFNCISNYITVTIHDSVKGVTCPVLDCNEVLEINTCKKMIPEYVIAQGDEAASEVPKLASKKFFCPFIDCSAILLNDKNAEVIRESECPSCHGLFCAQCHAPWHPGIKCEEFRRLNVDETEREYLIRELGKEVGESSQIFCEICVERKESHEMFRVERCCHSFCSDCISKHITVKIQDSIEVVTCPGLDCKGVLEINACKTMIPKDVIAQWDEALCRSLISASQKFYCPFKDCSAMLVDDDDVEVIRESECPECHRLFCAQCHVPWHSGISCEEFQRLNVDERGREDLMEIVFLKIAQKARNLNTRKEDILNNEKTVEKSFLANKEHLKEVSSLEAHPHSRKLSCVLLGNLRNKSVDFNFAMLAEQSGVKLMVVARQCDYSNGEGNKTKQNKRKMEQTTAAR